LRAKNRKNKMNGYIPGNEEGSVLVIAMIMLVLLTLIGISATTTSTIEVQISANDRIYKQNLCVAEGATMECIQRMENGGEEMKEMISTRDVWLIDGSDNSNRSGVSVPGADTITDPDNWRDSDTGTSQSCEVAMLDPNSRFMAFYGGIAEGASLDMTKPTVYEYRVFGRSTRNDGLVIIGVGYRKAI
jgi:type IV pilus assembly protein PilX